MNYVPNLIKIAIIVLSLAAIPVVYHIPFGFQFGVYHTRQRYGYHDFTTEHLFPNLSQLVFSTSRSFDKTRSSSKIESTVIFKIDMPHLYCIMKAIEESGSIGKTALSQKVNMNPVRVRPYLEWMYNKVLLESIIEDAKVKFKMTPEGLQFLKQYASP
ncbi:MAG: hypothetical protein KGI27_08785 [Thaumarchaeota archaeon]|nr:hypothetical protein [Nitrososphaerota archaeon]